MTNWLRSVFAPQRTIAVPPLPPVSPPPPAELSEVDFVRATEPTFVQVQHAARRQAMRTEAEACIYDARFVMTSMTADLDAIEEHMTGRWDHGAGLVELERHMRHARELSAAVYRLSAVLVEMRETYENESQRV